MFNVHSIYEDYSGSIFLLTFTEERFQISLGSILTFDIFDTLVKLWLCYNQNVVSLLSLKDKDNRFFVSSFDDQVDYRKLIQCRNIYFLPLINSCYFVSNLNLFCISFRQTETETYSIFQLIVERREEEDMTLERKEDYGKKNQLKM